MKCVGATGDYLITSDENGVYKASFYDDKAMKFDITNCIDIKGGDEFFVLLTSDKTLYGFGRNGSGQLGTGDFNEVSDLIKLDINDVKKVDCGNSSTVVLKNNGEIFGSGNNYGNPFQIENKPMCVKNFTKINIDNVKDFKCTENNIFFLKNDNTLWVSGYYIENGFYKIDINNVKDFFCYNSHTYILLENGEIYWFYADSNSLTRSQNDFELKGNIKKVYRKYDTGELYLMNDNTLILHGNNNYKQLGLYTSDYSECEIKNIKDVIILREKTVLVDLNDNLYVSGRNIGIDLEGYNEEYFEVFTKINKEINEDKTKKIKQIYGGGLTTFLFLDEENNLFINSENHSSENFYGVTKKFILENVVDCFCGGNERYFIKTNEKLYGLGYGLDGELGTEKGIYINLKEIDLKGIAQPNEIKKISISNTSSVLLKNDGTIYGTGDHYKMGSEFPKQTLKFTRINQRDVKDVLCNSKNTFILKNDGSIFCSGYNMSNYFKKANIDDIDRMFISNNTFIAIKGNGELFTSNLNITTNEELHFDKVNMENLNDCKKIVTNFNNCHIITKENELILSGDNKYNQLGIENKPFVEDTKCEIKNVKDVVILAGTTIVLDLNGNLYMCGELRYDENIRNVSKFTKINIENYSDYVIEKLPSLKYIYFSFAPV